MAPPKPSKHFTLIGHRFAIETAKDIEEVIVTFIAGSMEEKDSHYFSWFQGMEGLTSKQRSTFDKALMDNTLHKTFIDGNSQVTTVFNGDNGLLLKDFIRKENRTQVAIAVQKDGYFPVRVPD